MNVLLCCNRKRSEFSSAHASIEGFILAQHMQEVYFENRVRRLYKSPSVISADMKRWVLFGGISAFSIPEASILSARPQRPLLEPLATASAG